MKKILLVACGLLLGITGCQEKQAESSAKKQEMLIYCGITMVKPVKELADIFSKQHNIDIIINQGGSQDLYESLRHSQKGDIYLPGSLSYRKKYLGEGLLLDTKFVGYNKAALMVKKGNPNNIPADLNVLTSKEHRVALCNPDSGSIGNETKVILEKFGIFKEAMENAIFLGSDSRTLVKSIKDGDADVTINWYATGFWDGNREYVDIIPLDEKHAPKKMLVFNLLKSSKNPELAKAFMEFSASHEGRAVFAKYGFLDEEDLKNFDKVTF